MKSFLSLLMIVSLLSAFSYEETVPQTPQRPPQKTSVVQTIEDACLQRIPALLSKTFLLQKN